MDTGPLCQRDAETGSDATSRDHHLQVQSFLLGRRWSGLEETRLQDRRSYLAGQQEGWVTRGHLAACYPKSRPQKQNLLVCP